MKLKKFMKNFMVGSLLFMQIFGLNVSNSNAATDNIEEGGNQVYEFSDLNELKAKIIQDEDNFQRPLATIAYCLGFAWCGGTETLFPGYDFDFKMIDSDTFELKGHYDKNDPYADWYRAEDRLTMIIDNVKFYIDGDTLTLGEHEIYDLEPMTAISTYAYNYSNEEDAAFVGFDYETLTNWSKTDSYSFSESIGLQNTFSFDIGVAENNTTITAEFGAEQGWDETHGGQESLTQHQEYRATVPANSKRLIELTVFKQDAEVPFGANIYMTYDVTFDGFIKADENAYEGHPTDEPWVTYTFGGRNGFSGPQDLLDQYIHRDINGYSQWDYEWALERYNYGLKSPLSDICKTDFGGISEGKFEMTDGTFSNVIAYEPEPLTKEELIENKEGIVLEDINVEGSDKVKLIEAKILDEIKSLNENGFESEEEFLEFYNNHPEQDLNIDFYDILKNEVQREIDSIELEDILMGDFIKEKVE